MALVDKIKLFLAFLVLGAGLGAFYYFGNQSDLVRVGLLLVALAIAAVVALQSAPGRAGLEFAKSARIEIRKVVWPTRKETVQTTLVVIAMVILVGLYLWLVDTGLLYLVRLLTGQRS